MQLPSDVSYPPPLLRLLAEFAGLRLVAAGAGITIGRMSLHIDPAQAEGESGEDGKLAYFSQELGQTLYPLGVVLQQPLWVCMDAAGKVYLAGDDLTVQGDNFVVGISSTLLGIKGKQLLW